MNKKLLLPIMSLLFSGTPLLLNKNVVEVKAATPMPTNINMENSTDVEVSTYYSGVEGKSGEELLGALHEIIKGHNEYDYENNTHRLIYKVIDRNWDLDAHDTVSPANTSNFNYSADNGFIRKLYADYNDDISTADRFRNEGASRVSFDKEHIWPQSYGNFGRTSGAGSDFHSLWPSDVKINQQGHSNYHYANAVNNRTAVVNDKNTIGGYNGQMVGSSVKIFEPLDQYKGDVARAMFYMPARYFTFVDILSPKLELVNGTPSTVTATPTVTGKAGDLATLLEWHELDPVDDYEIKRNNLIANNYQMNRNPFIDYPQWARIAYDTSYSGPDASNALNTSSVGTGGDEFANANILSISVDDTNVKKDYYLNESFTTNGLTVTAYYDNNLSRVINNFSTNISVGTSMTTIGAQTITVSATHKNVTKTASYTINVVNETVTSPLVISEVYGGGGNSNAVFTHDYVELYNDSNSNVSLSGKSIQYSSPSSHNWKVFPLSGVIQANSYYLARLASNNVTVGGELPLADLSNNTINMGATNLKVAFVNGVTPLNSENTSSHSSVIDFLGAGNTNDSKGTALGALSNKTSAQRIFENNRPVITGSNHSEYNISSSLTPTNSAMSVSTLIMSLGNSNMQCLDQYPIFKEKIMSLTEDIIDEDTQTIVEMGQRTYFQTNTTFVDENGRLRYEAWSRYHGDNEPYAYNSAQNSPNPVTNDHISQSIMIFMVVVAIGSITYLKLRKNKIN